MRCAVLGSPIGHSLSPAMHRAAYTALGLDWTYDAIEVPAGGLSEFVRGLDGDWAGLSITAPLKSEAAALATTATDVVRELGVANTLVHGLGDWHAANTDVPGAANALAERGVTKLASVRILGGGATAASMLLVARRLGATEVEIVVRSPGKVDFDDVTVRNLSEPAGDPVDLLISTLPGDAVGSRAAEWAASAAAIFDVSYHPWPTQLSQVAGTRPFASGIDLLAHQAALQVELMTGNTVDVELLRSTALSA